MSMLTLRTNHCRGAITAAVLLVATACDSGSTSTQPRERSNPSPTATATTTPSPTASGTTQPPNTKAPTTPSPRSQKPLRGIDASRHQATVDFKRLAQANISFAYLKATEGKSYTDPTFANRVREARRAGLKVGGYHYFTLCSDGRAQGAQFARTLADVPDNLPPALDVELADGCSIGRDALVLQVRAFIDSVRRETRQPVVLYVYPDAEDRYRLRQEFPGRQWVRRIGNQPPQGPWFMWQKSDSAQLPGISGHADLNLMRTP